jgi:hypothetical protein
MSTAAEAVTIGAVVSADCMMAAAARNCKHGGARGAARRQQQVQGQKSVRYANKDARATIKAADDMTCANQVQLMM